MFRSSAKNAMIRRGLATLKDTDVVVCGLARTPIGKLGGALAPKTAPQLAAVAIAEAIKRSNINKDLIEEAFIGNVVSANIGQAPARQAVMYAGLKLDTPCTTVNKVCASGMKSVMFGALSIMSGYRHAVLAGGMESMSNIPYYLPQARAGYRLGNGTLVDGLMNDGLWDVYNNHAMGVCGEVCASKFSITREEQDQFAISSYERAAAAWNSGKMATEVVPVMVEAKKGQAPVKVERDEEFSNIQFDKLKTLRPAFKKDGSVTAANSSKINDGAAAMVVTSGKLAREQGLTPLFRIRGFGDAARDPVEFAIAPADAVPRALQHAGMSLQDVEYHEINEAFAVVALANARLMNIDLARLNVHGGAVALGHPLGVSGARIIGALYNVLKSKDATIGVASICNGGGGASAVVIERLN